MIGERSTKTMISGTRLILIRFLLATTAPSARDCVIAVMG